MFIDTSAVVSILSSLMGEPGGDRLAEAIAAAKQRLTSSLVRLEACMVLSTRLDIAPRLAEKQFDAFLDEAGVTVIPVTDKIGAMAVAAFEQFGRGRSNKAKLNLADCMSYACAKSYRAPILFTGRDFAKTDLKIALV
jgi:ribonuclease VapC